MHKGFAVAIDGPVAAGKGTVASSIADKITGYVINTGSMYRAVALYCIENHINLKNEEEVSKIIPNLKVEFKDSQVFLNSKNITERIKKPDVSEGSSVVAVYAKVREDSVKKQQELAKTKIAEGITVIIEGRDTGTVVLPDARLKIFLTASLETRAKRNLERYKEKGINRTLEDVILEIQIRDKRDTERAIGPLQSNPQEKGYWVLDSSGQTEEQTIDIILNKIREVQKENDQN